MKLKTLLTLSLLALPLAACSSPPGYVDPNQADSVDIHYGRGDLDRLSQGMVSSLLEAPGLGFLDHSAKGADKRIRIYFNNITNETREHISMGLIRDEMLSNLVGQGRFRVVAGEAGQDEISGQLNFQSNMGRVSPEEARLTGKQLGADVVVYGSLRDIVKRDGRSLENLGRKTKDVYYNLALRMDNIETGETIWMNTEKLAKREVISLFGR
jgi:uncharacterized protein (TIGR02722 family)